LFLKKVSRVMNGSRRNRVRFLARFIAKNKTELEFT